MTTEDEKIIVKELENRVIGFDTDYSPELSDVPLRSVVNGSEDFMVVYTSGRSSDDLALSILPVTEEYMDLVRVHNLKVIAKGTSTISLSSLSYGLQHSTRLLYKSLVQSLKHYYLNNVNTRFEEDDKLLRTELNKLI